MPTRVQVFVVNGSESEDELGDDCGPSTRHDRLAEIERKLETIAAMVADSNADAHRAHHAEMARIDEETTQLGHQLEELLAGAGSEATLNAAADSIHAISARLEAIGKPTIAPTEPPLTT